MQPGSGDGDLLESLARQEEECAFAAFDERVAFAIGLALCEAARVRSAPVVIDIRTADRTLFHAALPGSTPHNGDWARRKSNVTLRFHQSSMRVGEAFRLRGKTIGAAVGLDEMDYAAHGGSFPIRVRGTGVVGAITCSGLPSAEDHALIVEVIGAYLATEAGRGG